MPPRVIPIAVRRELDARFQAQNAVLDQIMNRLNEIQPPNPVPPVHNNQNPPDAQVPPVEVNNQVPVAPPAVLHVGEPIYERFRRQKPPTFDGSFDPTIAGD